MRRFVIISSPRSGTHMLRTALNSHPNVVCRAESFNPDLVGPEPYDTSWTTREILETEIYRTRQPKILASGFAVHRGGAPLGPWTDLWDHLLADPQLEVIILHRHDLLRRYLSFQVMRERNRSADPAFEPAPRRLEVEALRQEFRRYEAELANFRGRFAEHRRFQVSYEALRDHFPRTALRLQRFLRVSVQPVEAKTRRNPQKRLDALLTNLPELRGAFRGSRWEWFFQPEAPEPPSEEQPSSDRASQGKAQIVRAPASLIRRRAPGNRQRRDILGTEVAFYSLGREELVARDHFQDRRGCIFVDVGAGHPVNDSRTYYLEHHLGWLGVAISVDAEHSPIYSALRPRTRVCPVAPWDNAAPGSSTLGRLLEAQGVERIDWLTLGPGVDAAKALAGLDFRRHRPRLLHVAKAAWDPPAETRREDILESLRNAGYASVGRYATEEDLYLQPS